MDTRIVALQMSSSNLSENQQSPAQAVPENLVLFSLNWWLKVAEGYDADPRTKKFHENTSAIYQFKGMGLPDVYIDIKDGYITVRPTQKGDSPEFHVGGDEEKWIRWQRGDYGILSGIVLKIFDFRGPLWRALRMGPFLLIWDEYARKTGGSLVRLKK
jgi:hypothetical protein